MHLFWSTNLTGRNHQVSQDLLGDIMSQLDASPSARHLVSFLSRKLVKANFVDFSTDKISESATGFVAHGGSLVAWRIGTNMKIHGFRIVGAHTDSPCLKIKPSQGDSRFGFNTLQVEIYGSPLLNSWLDRDLGIAGHIVLKNATVKLFCSASPTARISQLAIHLDREVNERGLIIDKQLHLSPAWSTRPESQDFMAWVADQADVDPHEIVQIDAQLFDMSKSSLIGSDNSMLVSGRLDNQASCWAAVAALLDSSAAQATQVVALFDHEEVGSQSATGAAGPLLERCLEQLAASHDVSRIQFLDALRRSNCVSADNAHAVHHNYPERHDLTNAPIINHGPAIKLNSNQRYATSAQSAAIFVDACERANVPHQRFVSRNNMPCGATIGPITASRLGIDTVDVGVPQLSMHSAREVCGVDDLMYLRRALTTYFE